MDVPRVLSTTNVYKGRLFDIDIAELEMDDGVIARRETLRHPGAVAMVPVTAEGNLLMVTQYRHAAGRRLLEIPAGTLEPGEDPYAAAIRELQEEVGMYPDTVQAMGGFFVAPGYATEYIHLYICTDLRPLKLAEDEDEDLEVFAVSPVEVMAKIESGEICDAKTVIGFLRWRASGAAL